VWPMPVVPSASAVATPPPGATRSVTASRSLERLPTARTDSMRSSARMETPAES
jgi:hypothetical protein